MDTKIYEIPLTQIRISQFNVRKHDRDAEIEYLAQSIKKHGLLQPIVLRGSYGSPLYELIVGQRRFLAHKELGKPTIKAIFAGDVDDLSAKVLSLAENMQRVELNDADKAEAITFLYNKYDKNSGRVSRELRLPLRTVNYYIDIKERASKKAMTMLRQGKVSKADIKRAIDAAGGDSEKADRLLVEMSKLPLNKYQKAGIVEIGRKHPRYSATKIIEEGIKPRIERVLILNLTEDMEKALNKAKKALSIEKEEIAQQAITEWLKKNRYLE
jgi:ParB/RepB/Spo0J family partition protein